MKTYRRVVLLISLVVMSAGLIAPRPAGAQSKKAVNPPGSPTNLPFSNGILVGNTLYVAGTQGTISGDIKKEPPGRSITSAKSWKRRASAWQTWSR